MIDDISPLRQITDDGRARRTRILFKPADAINVLQGGDNGTPTQKDEPQAQNPPNGASIDYYLKTAAAGPVTLEILDAGGACVAVFTSDTAPRRRCAACGRAAADEAAARGAGGGIPNTSALWRPTPEPFATGAGMHRVTWAPGGGGGRGGGGRGGRGGGAAPDPSGRSPRS